MQIKSGLGYDIHRLASGRPLFLGGVEIPYSRGLAGHSDGDCLIHAMIDALLGAIGSGDIGQLFPDTDPKYKEVRSPSLLEQVVSGLRKAGVEIMNLDTVIQAEAPKLASHIPRMKEALCPILGIGKECLGIKAKTNEGLGEVGRKKAIAAWALALLKLR